MKRLTFSELATADPRTQRFHPLRSIGWCADSDPQSLAPPTSSRPRSAPPTSAMLSPSQRALVSTDCGCFMHTESSAMSYSQSRTTWHGLFWSRRSGLASLRTTKARYPSKTDRETSQLSRHPTSRQSALPFAAAAQPRLPARDQCEFSTRMPLALDPLLRWAHAVALLDGQRNRRVQLSVYAETRNHFAFDGNLGGWACRRLRPGRFTISLK